MSLAAVGLVTTGMLLKTGRITPKVAGGLVGIFLLIGTALTIHGMDRVGTRLDTIWTELGAIFSDDEKAGLAGRREVWQAAVETITDFPVLGTGIGSHAAVTKAYMPPTDKRIFTHAENSYLNLGVETGLIGLGLAIVSLVIGFLCCGVVFLKGYCIHEQTNRDCTDRWSDCRHSSCSRRLYLVCAGMFHTDDASWSMCCEVGFKPYPSHLTTTAYS